MILNKISKIENNMDNIEDFLLHLTRTYVCDELDELEIKSDYLCGHSENAFTLIETDAGSKMIPAYPVGEEKISLHNINRKNKICIISI